MRNGQAKEKLKENTIPKFYKGQKILWHQQMNKPGPGKSRIRWSGPYEIKEIYNNNTVDVMTLQGDSLGRVNMSKIKPFHEPLEAKAYVMEIDDTKNSSQGETIEVSMNRRSSQNNIHHNRESSYSRESCKSMRGKR